MKNFSRFDGPINIKGYAQHYFIEDNRILSLPADENGVIDLDNIVYTNPADKDWYAGASVIRTLDLGSNLTATVNGAAVPVNIEGIVAFQNAHNLKLFHEKSFSRFILLILDRNGSMRICGEPGNGLRFTFKEIQGGLSFSYSADYTHPCWYVTGNFTVDGTAYGAEYIPVTSTIQGGDGKSAYEIALENGFVGTEAAWLASLQGSDGDDGNTIIYGNVAPTNPIGNNGDTYINTVTNMIYGPKAGGVWPAGTSIIGAPGVAADEDFTTIAAFKFMYNY